MAARERAVRRGQATMIGLLVAMVLMLMLAAALWGPALPGKRPATGSSESPESGPAQTVLGKSLQQANGVECRNNLQQIRTSLRMDYGTEGRIPAQLAPVGGVPLQCPVSGQPYQYDPQTGQVRCPTPGHERY